MANPSPSPFAGTSLPVYSVADGSFRRWIELNVAGCERLASDPQGVVLYLASPRRTRTDVARLDIETGEKKALWPLKGRVLDFAAPPLPDRLFATNNAGALQNWEVEKSSGSAWSSGLNSDLRCWLSRRMLAGLWPPEETRWWCGDLEAKKISRTFEVDFASIHSVTWSPTNPDAVAVAGSGSAASIWSVTEGKVVSTFQGRTGDIADLAFSPDGTRLVAGTMSLDDIGLDANVLVWDVGTDNWFALCRQSTASSQRRRLPGWDEGAIRG